MFDLFRRKKAAASRAIEVANLAQSLVRLQLELAETPAASLSSDEWALGYMFGSHDAALQRANVLDQVQSLAAISVSFVDLFGSVVHGAAAVRACLEKQQSQVFIAGAQAGGADIYQFLRNQDVPPMALFDYISASCKAP